MFHVMKMFLQSIISSLAEWNDYHVYSSSPILQGIILYVQWRFLTVTEVDYCFPHCTYSRHCFLSAAWTVCRGDGLSQQLMGPDIGWSGPGGGSLPVAPAQCGRLASLLQHGSVQPGGFPLLLSPAACLLHCLHLWLVSTEWFITNAGIGGIWIVSQELIVMLCVVHRYEMQEAGVALDSAMKNFSMVQYSA